ncbi:MAG: anthranilate synthase component I family protein [Acidimicrobiia bacterium]
MAGATTASILAALPPDLQAVSVRAGSRVVVGVWPDEVVVASGAAAFERVDSLSPGWWAGFLAYDLGRAVEHVEPRRGPEPDSPADLMPADLVLARFATRAVFDPVAGDVEIVGDGPGRPLLEAAVRTRARPGEHRPTAMHWHSSLSRSEFEAGVERVLAHLRAGDCYQVNLTRRLTTEHVVDPVGLFAELERVNPAPYAGLLRLAGLSVVSASPECFLRWRGRSVETRPIKGTGTDPGALRASAKDRAENVMIVDLARNDLGRVCEPGSIAVPSLCAVEAHPGLHHLVSTVRGRLREDAGVGSLLHATFPPASVTGAPKPRVLQIIEDLEPVRRGVYCGAVGWIDTERDAGELAVAIRTFTMSGGATHLGVGAGIVADSRPDAEWAETELKAARLLAAAGRHDVQAAALAS